jgi:hypothetical protein
VDCAAFQLVCVGYCPGLGFPSFGRAVFGFPLFSLTDFSAREFAVDFGVYIVSFFAAYLLIRRTKDRRNESEQ